MPASNLSSSRFFKPAVGGSTRTVGRYVSTRIGIAVAAVLLISTTSQAFGTTYYVRLTGNDSRTGKTAAMAFRTIGKAVSVAVAGDSVYVGAGIYQESPTISRDGTSTNPIKFFGDKSGTKTGDAGTVQIKGRLTVTGDYIQANDFLITGATDPFQWRNNKGGLISGCEVYGTGCGMRLRDTDVLVQQCLIRDVTADGMLLEGEIDVEVLQCSILRCADDGIDCPGDGELTVRETTIKDCGSNGIETDKGTFGEVLVDRCRIQSNRKNGMQLGKNTSSLVNNTLISRNTGAGYYFDGSNRNEYAFISFSTITHNGQQGIRNVGLRYTYLRDNIVTFNGGKGLETIFNTSWDTNVFYGNGGIDSLLLTLTNIVADPKYVSVSSNDFRLSANSPAINKGIIPSLLTWIFSYVQGPSLSVDLDGNVRPIGSAPDIGAFEALSGGPQTYYVRVDGDDNRSGTSVSQAFRTLSKAATVVGPSCTVRVGPGTYREFVQIANSRSGIPNKPIKFVADTAGTVVWQLPSENKWGIECYADYIEFEGIRFTGANVTDDRLGFFGRDLNSLTFKNCEFDNLSCSVYTEGCGLTVDNSKFHDNSRSIAAHNGGVVVDRCDIRNNEYGPWLQHNHYALVKASTINDNVWALYISPQPEGTRQPFGVNTPTIQNCTIDSNENGLCLHQSDNTDQINFSNARLTNLSAFEMRLIDCTLTVTNTWRNTFPIDKGGSGILTERGTLTFDGFIAENYPTGWGLRTNYGDLVVKNSTFRSCLNGAGFSYPNTLDLRDSTFTANRGTSLDGWGLHIWNVDDNPANSTQITNCTVSNNDNGALLSYVTDDSVKLTNTTISNNTATGVQFHMSDVKFTPTTMGSRWKIANNGNGIVTYYGKAVFDGITMSDNTGWNVITNYGDITVSNSSFQGNGSGFTSYYNKSFNASNTRFSNNKGSWGLAYSSNGTYHDGVNWLPTSGVDAVTNCVIENNFNGVSLEGVKGNRITFIDSPIRNNTNYGLYTTQCEIDFTPTTMSSQWKISNNGHGITTYYGKHLFDNIELADNTLWGAQTFSSDIVVKNCRFTRNGTGGFQSSFNKSFKAENCKFDENGEWGLSYSSDGRYQTLVNGTAQWNNGAAVGEITDCVIEKNGTGMYVGNSTDGTIKLVNTPIRSNTVNGLYVFNSELSFTPATMGTQWQLSDNGNGITTYYGKILFDGVEIADNRAWGVMTYYGDVTVKNSRFTRNPEGGFSSSFNKSLKANNCRFDSNTAFGVAYASDGRYGKLENGSVQFIDGASPGEFKDCVIENNGSGMRISNSVDSALQLLDTPIRNNTTYGLYVVSSDMSFTSSTMGTKWQLSGNGTGITTYYGKTLFDGAEIADNRLWGVRTYYGDVTVKNSRFTRNPEGGFESNFNKSFKAENCKFDNNAAVGVAYYSDGRYYGYQNGAWQWNAGATPGEFANCVIEKNGTGMRLENCTDGTLVMTNTPIRSNTTHGLYVVSSDLSFTTATMGSKWQLSDNGNGITTYYGKILFDGVEVADNRLWGACTYYGDIVVRNSKFKRNPSGGFLSYFNKSFKAEGCNFDENNTWGFGYHSDGKYYGNKNGVWDWHPVDGPGQIVNCTASRNQTNGMYLSNVTNANFQVINTQVTGNGAIGVAFYNSTIKLSPTEQDRWTITSNVHGLHASNSNVTVEDSTVTGNSEWGMYTYYSNVSLKNAKFNGNGHGMYWYSEPWTNGWDEKLTVENCQFDNNTVHHGLLASYGPVAIKNSSFNGNKGDGLYTLHNKSCVVDSCEMKSNGRWGANLAVNYPDWNAWEQKALFQDNVQTLTNCTISGNANGLAVYNAENSNFDISQVTIEGNQADGVYFNDCKYVWDTPASDQIVIRNNGYGVTGIGQQLDLTLKSVIAENCGEYGLRGFDGKFRAENCRVTGTNYVGFYSVRTTKTELVNCRFDGAPRTSDGSGWGALTYGSSPDVRNCVFNGYPNGASPYTYGDESTTPQPKFFNNTFANLDYWGFHLPNGQAEVRNCIFAAKAGNTDGYGIARSGGSLAHGNNLVFGFGAPYYNTAGTDEDVLENPRFVSAATGDFHLAQGSPAINTGSEAVRGLVDNDMDGNPRPSFKRWEVGAYEYLDDGASVRVLKWSEKK